MERSDEPGKKKQIILLVSANAVVDRYLHQNSGACMKIATPVEEQLWRLAVVNFIEHALDQVGRVFLHEPRCGADQ